MDHDQVKLLEDEVEIAIAKVMRRLARVKQINIDAKRVFATGISNGGIMCYRLASELSTGLRPLPRSLERWAQQPAIPSGPCR